MMSFCSARCSRHVLLGLLFFASLSSVHAQAISTSMPVPPLQWINLSQYLQGSAAPPLKDASIGYDDTNRVLLIFGGESQQGFPTSGTYLIDLANLRWASPQMPSGLVSVPPARSAAIGGDDSAASYRHGHIVIDGQTSNNSPLSDVWEFDYTSQFWANVGVSPGGPSGRWGAVGGIDPRVPFTTDPKTTTPNNTFYMAGGYDGQTVYPLSEVWRLEVSGTLSSNLPQAVNASWSRVTVQSNIEPRVSVGGTVIGQQIVAIGGCTSAASAEAIVDGSCAVQDSQIIDASNGNVNNISPCIAPRVDPTVVPNMCQASTSFGSQAFVLFGTFNHSLWDDGGGLERGEVAVLDVGTGAWARVLPAGDPGSNGKVSYPVPRQGAAAISWNGPLVGDTSIAASDTIIFGGRDANGNYLSDVWLLRAYNATLTSTNQTWSGFGSGSLTTGVSANGQGVTIQYIGKCAASLASPTSSKTSGAPSGTSTSGSSESSGSSGQASPSSSSSTAVFHTSTVHKVTAAVSVALFFPALALYRLSSPTVRFSHLTERHLAFFYSGAVLAVAAYGLGIAGLATAFTSMTSTNAGIVKRSVSSAVVPTAHSKAGLALFAGMYGLVPILQLVALAIRRFDNRDDADQSQDRLRTDLTAEKLSVNGRAASPSQRSEPLSHEASNGHTKRRVRSWAGIGTWAGLSAGRRSNETTSEDHTHTPSQRSFEVVNRPIRQRRASGNSLAAFSDPRPTHTPRNLSDMSWLEPRRSTSGMGELGYNLSSMDRRAQEPWTPGTTPMEVTSTNGLMAGHQTPCEHPVLPTPFEGFIHVLFHALLLALSVFSLVTFWQRGPKVAFGVFLAWTVVFYVILVSLAWNGYPRESILSVIFSRLRAEPVAFSPVPRVGSPSGSRPMSTNESVAVPFPSEGRGPYQHHQPPYRAALSAEHDYPTSLSHGHGSPDVDDDDEEDEDTRQRRIEEELSRREVSIVTVPKRRLYVLNPNPPEDTTS
ncbi:hypothetical protein BD414DRAFT_574874 [Trametes punicea]|nr:hypothetical protein BD414DRAFT_574874 [Trametes punicea]